MDPLMDERFFIEEPEKLENNFFNQDLQKEFRANFSEKSKQIIKITSMKYRHAKKVSRKQQKQQQTKIPNRHQNDQKKMQSKDNQAKDSSGLKSSDKPSSSNQRAKEDKFEYEPVLTSILNEKKAALMKSPEVTKFLSKSQKKDAT